MQTRAIVSAAPSTAIFHTTRQQLGVCNRHRWFLSINSPPRTCHLNLAQSNPKRNRLSFVFITRAADSTQPSPSVSVDKTVVPDDGFSIAKVSFLVFVFYLSILELFSVDNMVTVLMYVWNISGFLFFFSSWNSLMEILL